ncbi:YveK family protein [Exiguobacterium algae]|uniref:YveK family protein n=1 Tax=Exiguobacterium algae TaxID=2751250 RepID=UPI001BE68FFA
MNSQTMLLSELLAVFKKSKLLVFITILLMGGAAYYLSQYVIEPKYEASTQVLIVPKQEAGSNVVDSTQVSSSLSLINTYRVIMRSPAILNDVQERVTNAPEDISEVLVVESEEDSQVINIVVEYTDPVVAAEIANVITDVFANEIPALMNIDNVRVLSLAEIPNSPISPNIILNTLAGLVVGFVAGGVLALIRYTFDKRIRDEHELELLLSMPVIGTVPVIEKRDMAPSRAQTPPGAVTTTKGEKPHVQSPKKARQSS